MLVCNSCCLGPLALPSRPGEIGPLLKQLLTLTIPAASNGSLSCCCCGRVSDAWRLMLLCSLPLTAFCLSRVASKAATLVVLALGAAKHLIWLITATGLLLLLTSILLLPWLLIINVVSHTFKCPCHCFLPCCCLLSTRPSGCSLQLARQA